MDVAPFFAFWGAMLIVCTAIMVSLVLGFMELCEAIAQVIA